MPNWMPLYAVQELAVYIPPSRPAHIQAEVPARFEAAPSYAPEEGPRRRRPREEEDWDDEEYDRPRRKKKRKKMTRKVRARIGITIGQSKAAGILFIIAFLQFMCGGLLMAIPAEHLGNITPEQRHFTVFLVMGIGGAFVALGVWAMFGNPLIPTILGLVLYLAFFILDVAANPEMVLRGVLIRVLVIAGLVKALHYCLTE